MHIFDLILRRKRKMEKNSYEVNLEDIVCRRAKRTDNMAEIEEQNFNLAQYVLGHMDDLESIPSDTLIDVYQYLEYFSELKFEDSREKLFHSSQESWKHINNPMFIELVQTFYYQRHQFQDFYNTDYAFHKPISIEEQYQISLQNNYRIADKLPELLSQLLKEPRIEYYITFSATRQNYYRETANEWRVISDQCKFYMGITDEELKEYVEQSEHFGRLVKKKDLIGTWTADMNDEVEELTFFDDGKFIHTFSRKTRTYAFSGAGIINGHMEGTWTIKGDTLVRVYPHNKYHYSLDYSNISYNEDQKEKVEEYIKLNEENIQKRNELAKADTTTIIRKNTAYINASGQMVELIRSEIDEDGNEQKRKSYMLRINEKK